MSVITLSTAYLPPVEYVSFLLKENIQLEYCEHFQKQSFRNRTHILTGNGVQSLSIPVINGNKEFPIVDARIDYRTFWQRDHWRTIVSAYNNSPYFLYYQDAFKPFYEQHYTYLMEYNESLLKVVCQLLQAPCSWTRTSDYERYLQPDLRQLIHPKRQSRDDYPYRLTEPYAQVFSDRFGFTPNLSILDLLFNEGPQAATYLKNHCRF
ncbi:MAG: WbqC family protein [Bacteroidales bacterium]|nr:WbqC family protein [Bacteroidales bacterium]